MHCHNNISDFEALMNTPDNTADNCPANNTLAIIASLALVVIAIVFN